MTNGFHHELLDRLYIIMDMWNDYIVEHDSDDLLSKSEKQEIMSILSDAYQKVGARINYGEDE